MPKNRVARPLLSRHGITPQTLTSFLILILTGILSGCANNPNQEETRLLAAVPVAELNRASALESQGKATDAVALYLELAGKAQPPARAQLQIKAVRTAVAAGQTSTAQKTLDVISRQELTPSQRDMLLFTEADLALLQDHPRDAIKLLQNAQVQSLPKELKLKRLGTLASAQRLVNDPLAAAHTLDELDRLLSHSDERLLNQVSLISTLNLLGNSALQDLARKGERTMQGWAEIALLIQESGINQSQMDARYRQWRQGHSGHPALPELARATSEHLSGGYAKGDQVTIMLPRSGRFAAAANAIRSGIEAANHEDQANTRPALDFADVSSADYSQTSYAKAIKQGADYVIGPLQKPAVDALAASRVLTVPTLALNETTRTDRLAKNLFQFSLSPENEATEVANKAYSMGLKRALVLYPEGAWGERLALAFRQQWNSLGGSLSGQLRYNPSGSNDKLLKSGLDKSNADLLFLITTADIARKLYPAIRNASAKPITVISTSHVYSGAFDPKRDAGLIGLYFVDIPWMLDASVGQISRDHLGRGADPLARLYAMGIDAYRLAPRLVELTKNPGAYYPGQTGGLSIDRIGRIQRQLELGRFTDAGPRRVDATVPEAR